MIRFARKDGTPVSDRKVVVTQRTHDFAFGNLIRQRPYANEQYRPRFLEIFNFIQLLEFNWGQYEREEGKPQLTGRRAFIDDWCRTNGLTRLYGHMLTWAYQVDEPRDIGSVNPFWLFRNDRYTQRRLLKQPIEREVRAYHDLDILWDVVNEPIHCRRRGDWNKPNDVDERIADVLPYVRDALICRRISSVKVSEPIVVLVAPGSAASTSRASHDQPGCNLAESCVHFQLPDAARHRTGDVSNDHDVIARLRQSQVGQDQSAVRGGEERCLIEMPLVRQGRRARRGDLIRKRVKHYGARSYETRARSECARLHGKS